MSRVIKFRAWYKPTKEMLLPEKIESINFETKVLGVYLPIENRGFNKLRMSDFELMQFTGIKDRNGTDIYENDVIKGERIVWTESQHYGGTAETKGIVIFAHGRFVLQDVDSGAQPDLALGSAHHEVIGNIYTMPELLEVNHEE